jgi:hypothetical protein
MKRFTEQQLNELNFIRDWCNLIINYLVELGEIKLNGWEITIKENFQKGYIEGVRDTLNDMNTVGFDLPKEEFTELNRRLKERFGKTLYDFQKNSDKKIAQIIKRRKIRNEDEFRLAQMHIDRIFQDTEKEEEWKILEDLCFEFEQSVEVS